ncbi:hypothetical protein GCM10009814_05300 [Lapillicoccus jejuensis]
MRSVDDLTPPPAPDFAARAMAAARTTSRATTADAEDTGNTEPAERLVPVVPLHRRPWARALTGVAAALVLGTAALSGLQHVGGGSSASSGAAAQPEAGTAQGPASADRPAPADAAGGSGAGTAGSTVPGASLLGKGSATGAATTSLPDAVARLQQRLREPPFFDLRPTVALRGGTVVVTLQVSVDRRPALDPALVDLVSRSLPAGTPVEYRAP